MFFLAQPVDRGELTFPVETDGGNVKRMPTYRWIHAFSVFVGKDLEELLCDPRAQIFDYRL